MTQEFVTLPREVVERAIDALKASRHRITESGGFGWKLSDQACTNATAALRSALEQPKNHIEQHLGMVPAGWKLVPIELTDDMLDAAHKDLVRDAEIDMMLKGIHSTILAAAPQPPTTEDSSVVQPQSNQPAMTPIAQRKLDSLLAEGYTISGYSVYHERRHQHGFVTGAGLVGWWKPEGMEYPQPLGEQEPALVVAYDKQGWRQMLDDMREIPDGTPLYTHPQPKREPLTDAQAKALLAELTGRDPACANDYNWDYELRIIRAIERAHGIK